MSPLATFATFSNLTRLRHSRRTQREAGDNVQASYPPYPPLSGSEKPSAEAVVKSRLDGLPIPASSGRTGLAARHEAPDSPIDGHRHPEVDYVDTAPPEVVNGQSASAARSPEGIHSSLAAKPGKYHLHCSAMPTLTATPILSLLRCATSDQVSLVKPILEQ